MYLQWQRCSFVWRQQHQQSRRRVVVVETKDAMLLLTMKPKQREARGKSTELGRLKGE
jgi:hypothetical protein